MSKKLADEEKMATSATSTCSGAWTGLRLDPQRQKSPKRETHRSLMAKLDDFNDDEIQFQRYKSTLEDFGDRGHKDCKGLEEFTLEIASVGLRHYQFDDGTRCENWETKTMQSDQKA